MKHFIISLVATALFSACQNHNSKLSYDNKPNPVEEKKEINASPHGASQGIEQMEITIETVEGGISIAELYANKKSYKAKTVKIKGRVTKFNPEIMGTNWIHIQDGTAHKDKYDLTATSAERMLVGDTVVLEGKLTLDKDLGAGYLFEVLLEDCKVVTR